MNNQSSLSYSPGFQPSSDIVKAIKKSYVSNMPPIYKGEKAIRRTETTLTFPRHADEWKDHFHRRAKQRSKGFFSSTLHPYEELGHTETDTKNLVINALNEIGRKFDFKVSKCCQY